MFGVHSSAHVGLIDSSGNGQSIFFRSVPRIFLPHSRDSRSCLVACLAGLCILIVVFMIRVGRLFGMWKMCLSVVGLTEYESNCWRLNAYDFQEHHVLCDTSQNLISDYQLTRESDFSD